MRGFRYWVISSCLFLPATALAGSDLVTIDDFDGDENPTATRWWTGADKNGLGTTLSPDPFQPEVGGSPVSPKRHARIHGHFGQSRPPYPWATLQLALSAGEKPVDLSGFAAVQFYARGTGTAKVQLVRDAIKDYADYEYVFEVPNQWRLLTIPLEKLHQPSGWGKEVARGWTDVKQIKFSPAENDADYDLGIDDVAFVRAPGTSVASPWGPVPKIPQLSRKELTTKKIAYTPVPLGPEAKWAFADEKEGDGKGGWTDQGANSIAGMPTGKRIFEGVPFQISTDAKHQAIVLRGHNAASYPNSAEVKVGAKGKAIYFLHGAAWATGIVGTYTILYADGQAERIELRNNQEIFDWWSPGQSGVARTGWIGKNSVHSPIGLTLFAWENPHPGSVISSIKAETKGTDAFLMLAGITIASDGPYLPETEWKTYSVAGAYPYDGFDLAKRKGSALDMSFLLDAPAGKHGYLKKPEGESFFFDDGTEARFFGLNIVAGNNFPSHEQAERFAELLAQMGVNITRHHHMDAPWADRNVFGKKSDTRTLDAESLERFDYLIAQLQKRGIYQYLDLLVHRKASEADGIADASEITNGYKMYGSFVPELIQLQKDYARQLLTHRNPYTGKTYGEDPAVVMQEIINEDSPLYRNSSPEFTIHGDRYRNLWNGQWNRWLAKNIGDRSNLESRWSPHPWESDKKGLLPDEDPEKGNVYCIDDWTQQETYRPYSRQRMLDTFYYYAGLQTWFYREMSAWVRKFRPKGLITGSNHWSTMPIDGYINVTVGDYLDRHEYWAHPTGGWAIAGELGFNPDSMTKDPQAGFIGALARRRVKGHPMIVSEWQTAAPNDYRQEGLWLMAAESTFQNWSAIEFEVGNPSEKPTLLTEPFSSTTPKMLAAWPAAALLYHRQDLKRASEGAFYALSDADVYSPDVTVHLPDGLAVAMESGTEFTRQQRPAVDLAKAARQYVKGNGVTSSTGEVTHDWEQGLFRVDTARSQGFVGFTRRQKQSFGNFEAKIDNDYALVSVSALEKKPIGEADRLLVSVVGNAVNKGYTLYPTGNRVRSAGELPVMIEPITGTLTIKNLRGNTAGTTVWALDASGTRTQRVPTTATATTISFKMDERYRAQHYEVVR